MNDYYETMQIVHDEERNADREREQERRENFRVEDDDERAQYNEEVEQDIYERDDKIGAI